MRYDKDHRDQTRRHIVDGASKLFRHDGVASVGVRRLMLDVGLTHGGFYAHFPSRSALVAEAVQSALIETRASLVSALESAPEDRKFQALVDAYLDPLHRDRPEKGCAGATLAAEVARGETAVRESFSSGIDAVVDLFAQELPAQWSNSKRFDVAYAVFSMLMGALQLSRTTNDPKRSEQILAQAKKHAMRMVCEPT